MDEPTSSFSMGDLVMNLPPLMTGSMPPPTTPGHSVLESVTLPYFQQAMSHPASHWLLNTKMENTQESSPAYCREILSYFHEVSSDTKQWLQQYSDKKQVILIGIFSIFSTKFIARIYSYICLFYS